MGNVLFDLTDEFEITVSSRSDKKYLQAEHVHNYHELHYLIRGTAEYFIDHDMFQVNSGDYIFIKSGLAHKTICQNGSERCIICFSDVFLENKYQDVLEEFGFLKYMEIPLRGRYEIEDLLKRMETEYSSKKKYYLDMCRSMLQELIFIFHRYCDEKKRKGNLLSDNEGKILDAKVYITENFNQNIRLSDLADRCAVSPEHFSRTFKKLTGFGVMEYISMVRIMNAEKLLESGKYSITEISVKCGFNNSNYFTTVFKRQKGISPREYVRIHRIG